MVSGTFGNGLAVGATDGIAHGAGTRMFFNPNKAAFRAGDVDGTQWDNANIGDYSTAMGAATLASGYISTAMGADTEASGTGSTAIGYITIASGNTSTAMGGATTASGDNSTAMGMGTTASGLRSTAMGNNTIASGTTSTAMGSYTTASAWSSTAMGRNTTASGDISTAMGADTEASGIRSTAMGDGTAAPSFAETAIGRYNTTYTPASTGTWNAADRLFVVGNGTSGSATSDAMVILKNGNTGIGTSAPTANLSVNGTANKPGGGSWAAFSDRRLKQNITPYSEGLEQLLFINPVKFQYNELAGTDTKKEYVGVIAQELKEVAPYMVGTFEMDNTQYYDVDNSAMMYMLINAVKELNADKEEQQEMIENSASQLEVDQLRAENEALRSRLDKMEVLLKELAK
jgi:hypothetical protein